MSVEAQELCMRRDYFQIISGEGMGMGDTFFINGRYVLYPVGKTNGDVGL